VPPPCPRLLRLTGVSDVYIYLGLIEMRFFPFPPGIDLFYGICRVLRRSGYLFGVLIYIETAH